MALHHGPNISGNLIFHGSPNYQISPLLAIQYIAASAHGSLAAESNVSLHLHYEPHGI